MIDNKELSIEKTIEVIDYMFDNEKYVTAISEAMMEIKEELTSSVLSGDIQSQADIARISKELILKHIHNN